MYILLPLLLIVISLSGIVVIVARKLPRLKGLGFEPPEAGSDIFSDFFPEAVSVVKKVKIRGLWRQLLVEAEKLIRRFRVIFLKVDRVSDAMIKKIRRIHKKSVKNDAGLVIKEETIEGEAKVEDAVLISSISPISNIGKVQEETGSEDGLKKRERELIIKIAQNPKDSGLYEKLGDLYYKMGDFGDAKESYETSLKIDPGNENVKKKLEKVFKKLPT